MPSSPTSILKFNQRIVSKDFNIPVFKFIPFNYVAAMFKNHEVLIGQTIQWEDVYENFLLKSASSPEHKKYLPVFYGQCWTFRKETDALWRIYSPSKQSVRIKTTIRKLSRVATLEKDLNQTVSTTLGPVRYFQPARLRKWVSAEKRKVINSQVLTESLFIKRTEFSHESEMRIIFQKDFHPKEKYNRFIRLTVDPNELIDEITFDPRVDAESVDLNSHILRTLGYKNRITRSSLYDFHPPGQARPHSHDRPRSSRGG